MPILESVCARPKRILRRERRLERLDRIQQMDDACLRWFVRQPGKTILEKAGPRQRVLSVIREETADTHENRVVRDFIERCLRASHLYVRENRQWEQSYRVRLVHRFRNRLRFWLRYSPFAEVPRPTGIPAANYVLQFDDRYRRLWDWYERLRRQQNYQDDVWRWQNRTWAEHMTLALMHAFSELQIGPQGFKGRAFVRTDPACGQFIDSRSAIGSWVVNHDEPLMIETIAGPALSSIAEERAELAGIIALGPDVVCVAHRGLGPGRMIRILAAWTVLRVTASHWQQTFDLWARDLAQRAHGSLPKTAVTVALLVPDLQDMHGQTAPVRISKRYNGLSVIGFRIPIPVNRHLGWITAQVKQWAAGNNVKF